MRPGTGALRLLHACFAPGHRVARRQLAQSPEFGSAQDALAGVLANRASGHATLGIHSS